MMMQDKAQQTRHGSMPPILSQFKNWWKSLSVSRKLFVVVGIMALLIAMELFTLLFAMNTLSAVRALVGAEGSWSKAQKNAVLEIQRYARYGDESHYLEYKKYIEIPLGDHQARIEMLKPDMDLEVVRRGFLQGQFHADDIEPVVTLLLRFHQISYIQDAMAIWKNGDELLFELIAAAERLHVLLSRKPGPESQAEIQQLLVEIAEINAELTELENRFSFILGEASRWLEHLLMLVLVIAVATVESTGLILTVVFSRSLTRVLKELHDFATTVGRGDLSRSLPVRSADELGSLAQALNKMATDLRETNDERQIAEKANQIKSLFLANMSHEIRTPINSIVGFVELLKDPSLSDAERQSYLGIIERTGTSLATIINDILDISKVEAGRLEIEKASCSMPQILNDLKALLNLRCEHKGISLTFKVEQVPEQIVTDATRFKQILLNIIGNAIKFTDQGGVTVSIFMRGSQLICKVEDTGVGVSQQNAGRLFQPFSQIDLSIRKKFGGTGLGLILSKRLAQFLGGDVVLEKSVVGKGSTFTVSIAIDNVDLASATHIVPLKAAEVPRKAKSLQGKRVLVVEDSLDNQLLTRQYLVKEGAEVDIANHGLEALGCVAKAKYDLVLMDMQMPVMDGYAAATEMRRLGFEMPIIALTAHAMKADLQKCLTSGCNSYLSKPFRREGLIELIHQHCRSAA